MSGPGAELDPHGPVRARLVAMQAALLVEVDELRENGAQHGRDCHGGVRRSASGSRWTYAFSDVPGARLMDDLPIRLLLPLGEGEVDGDVVSHHDGELVVGVGRDLGPAIDHAVLVTDASFLLERLATRLAIALEEDDALDLDAVARVLGLTRPTSGTAPVPDDVAAALNEEQCAAVSLALGSDLTYVWGPPGTGKTTTVAHLVAAHYRAGRSVLVVSNTNAAVDTAVGRIAELLEGDPGFDVGEVLRHRAIVDDDLRERYGARLDAAAVLGRVSAPIVAERLRLDAELSALDTALDDASAAARTLRDRAEELDRQLGRDEGDLLAEARVVAATVYQTWLGGLPERTFDVVVVDEASMVMLPMTAYVVGLGASAVVAGDFRQLSAIVTTRDDEARRWLATDAFTAGGIPAALADGDAPPYLAALRTQYRMRPAIAELVTALYYPDNPLRTGRAERQRSTARALPTEVPLVYVDTGPLGAWAGYWGRGSRFNPLHALVVAEVAEALAPAPDVLAAAAAEDSSLGVVTPYAAQERLVAALLTDRHGLAARGWSSTVHRFQGNEKDAIVVDLTDASGVGPGPGTRAAGRDEAESRLLNVAISRARDCLVVVADFGYLRRRTPRTAIVRALLDGLEEHGSALLPGHGERDGARLRWPGEDARAMPVPHLLTVYDAGGAVAALTADLERASDEIAIWSPVVTPHGMAVWSAALRGAVARGVTVRVVTRPPSEQPAARVLLDQMRGAGVGVDLCARMEERLAVVDGRSVWHGGTALGAPLPTGAAFVRARSTALAAALVGLLRPSAAHPRRRLGESTTGPCGTCGEATALQRSAGSAVAVCTGGCR